MEEHTNMPNVNKTGEKPKRRPATAESMAAKQRDISVSEFFAKNRHLLGFDNPRKALLTAVKEAVDNSPDACEEAGIVPEIWVHIDPTGPCKGRSNLPKGAPTCTRVPKQQSIPIAAASAANASGLLETVLSKARRPKRSAEPQPCSPARFR